MLLIVEVSWTATTPARSRRETPHEIAAIWAGPSGRTFEVFEEHVEPGDSEQRQRAIALNLKRFIGLYEGPSDMLACWDPNLRFDLARWCHRVSQDDVLDRLHSLNLDNAFANSMKLAQPVTLDQALALTELRTPVDTQRPLYRATYIAKLMPWILGNSSDQAAALERQNSGTDSSWSTLSGSSRFASI